ncbi:MAG: ORF6N domain-containing protein [Lachnospiraceae bacterium]|nr:ORF6N domain-containing protein [Lachnospiraceae bacterium]
MAKKNSENDEKLVVEETEVVGTEIAIIDEQSIRDKIYKIRGTKVMLDFELAQLYGYETKNFNRQVKNNAKRFVGEEFMFQLTDDEVEKLSRCKNFTLNKAGGRGSNIKYKPYVFTEQGIYMLMTVLRGELAICQSRALVKAFKAMKDYIVDSQPLIAQHDYLHLSMQVSDTQQAVRDIQSRLIDHDEKLKGVFKQLCDTVKRSEISPFMLDFSKTADRHEYLILNGEPAKADETYMQIYSEAKKKIFIVDNYISIKTLRLLKSVKDRTEVIVFSDNLLNMLHASDDQDFRREFPNINISYKRTNGIMHDRFIVLDFATSDERMFHCGASSKDAGDRMTAITEFRDEAAKNAFHSVIQKMLRNNELRLR